MRPRAIPLVIAATLLAELMVASPSSTAPLTGGVLAFASDRAGVFDIYQAAEEEDGGPAPGRLTRGTEDQLDPAWSLDGTRFAYARSQAWGTLSSIRVGGLGGPATVLTSGAFDRQPTWSPDGRRLAFVRSSRHKGTARLYTIRSEGGGLSRLTSPGKGKRDWAPAWSPDGQQVAFASTRSSAAPHIYVMASRGGGIRRLTSGSWLDGNPSWSPDGRIVFERCCPGGSSEIYVVDPATKVSTRLTSTPEDEFDPAWSPDGRRIAFVSAPAGGGNRDVMTMAADGSDVRRVTTHLGSDLAPSWRPHSACDVPEACASTEDEASEDEAAAVEEDGQVETAVTTQAGGPGKIRHRSTRVARGVTLIRRVHRRGPKRVFALVVNPRKRPFDVALAGGRLRGLARTRSLAKAHRALAAVNGDFALPNGSPVHAFAEDGSLKRTTLAQGTNFAVSQDQRQAYVGPPKTVVLLGEDTGGRFRVTRLNDGAPVVGEIAGYSGAGAGVAKPPRGSCIARLRVTGEPRWYGEQRGLERTYGVKKAGCFAGRVSRGAGNLLLAARPGTPEGAVLASLTVGGKVTLRWSLGWEAVMDSVGGTPMLLEGGKVVATKCKADICRRHPRTAIGFTSKGKLILMVVDGRRKRWSVGMTLVQLAKEMKRLGARGAVNLDGGGSSTMVVKGRIKNRPSDGSERAVSSAVLVLRKRGGGGPSSAASEVAPAGETEEARSATLLDPASTGGLLDALERGALGGRSLRLPANLREILSEYRRATRAG